MADIQYLNYGDQQIEQEALLKNMADQVVSYVNRQPWTKKRKEKFMSAYSDIINHGILGASPSSGQWMVNVGGDQEYFDNMSEKDKEIYQNAAYFIQQQMSKMPVKEAEKKTALTNENFIKGFNTYVNDTISGGRPLVFGGENDGWNYLDERQKNGLRLRTNRAAKLAELLTGYRQSLDLNNYSFEGSPFKDVNDLDTRIQKAVHALTETPDNINDDTETLTALGIQPSLWFNNGSGDFSGKYDKNGNKLTYADLANLKNQQQQAAAQATQQQAAANPLIFIKSNPKMSGKTPQELKTKYQDSNTLKQVIQGYSQRNLNNLTPDEQSEIHGIYKYLAKDPVSSEVLKELQKSKNYAGAAPNRFRMISGIDNYVWDNYSNQVIQLQNKDLYDYNQQSNKDLFQGIKTNKEKLEERKKTTIGDNGGLTDDMKADLTAMGLDLVSAGTAFIPGYGTLASAITGISSTVSGAVADRMRGESWGSTLGTAGFGLSMDILGLIPGAGVGAKAAKIAKVVSKGAKWIGPILGGMAALAYGPGAISAYNKMISGKTSEISAEELRDFTYAIRAIAAGGIRKAGTTYQGNREIARALTTDIKSGKNKGKKIAELSIGKQSASITTKSGKSIKLTEEEFKTLKSNANREDKINILKSKGVEETDIDWAGINPIKGRFKTTGKSNKLNGLEESTESSRLKWNTTDADYTGIRRFSNQNLLRNYTTMSGFNGGIWKSIRDRWTGQDILNRQTPTSSQPTIKGLLPGPAKISSTTSTSTGSAASTAATNIVTTPKGTSVVTPVVTPTVTPTLAIKSRSQKALSSPPSKKALPLPRKALPLPTEDQVEVNNWIDSYKLDGGRSKLFGKKGGYNKRINSSNAPKGTIHLRNSQGEDIIYDRDAFGNITITVGNNKQQFASKNFQKARNYMAQQLYDSFKTNKTNWNEMGNILRELKRQKIFKQGGTIDRQKIQKYKDFINK